MDTELIQAKIDIVEQNMNFLEQIAKTEYEEFENNYRDILATKHALQECIEACLDIANHIISTFGYRRADDYSDMFRVLKENGIIDKDLSERLEKMAKFRNLLVHRYAVVETKRLHRITKEDLKDIRDYIKSVLDFLSKE